MELLEQYYEGKILSMAEETDTPQELDITDDVGDEVRISY